MSKIEAKLLNILLGFDPEFVHKSQRLISSYGLCLIILWSLSPSSATRTPPSSPVSWAPAPPPPYTVCGTRWASLSVNIDYNQITTIQRVNNLTTTIQRVNNLITRSQKLTIRLQQSKEFKIWLQQTKEFLKNLTTTIKRVNNLITTIQRFNNLATTINSVNIQNSTINGVNN